MYEMASYYNQFNMMGYNGHRFDPSQLNMVGTPLNMVNANTPPPTTAQNPIMSPPPAVMRPNTNEQPGSNLGFQMNPVSKTNKKKWFEFLLFFNQIKIRESSNFKFFFDGSHGGDYMIGCFWLNSIWCFFSKFFNGDILFKIRTDTFLGMHAHS